MQIINSIKAELDAALNEASRKVVESEIHRASGAVHFNPEEAGKLHGKVAGLYKAIHIIDQTTKSSEGPLGVTLKAAEDCLLDAVAKASEDVLGANFAHAIEQIVDESTVEYCQAILDALILAAGMVAEAIQQTKNGRKEMQTWRK